MDLSRLPEEESWEHVDRVFVALADKEEKAPSTITSEEQNIIDVFHSFGIIGGDGVDNLFLIDEWPRIVEAYRHVSLTKAYEELSAVRGLYESYMKKQETYSADAFRQSNESRVEEAETILNDLEDSIMDSLSKYINDCARNGKIILPSRSQ